MTAPVTSVGIIGLGNWGTALGNHLARKGMDVLGWSNIPGDIEGINSNHRNPSYLKEVLLHERFKASQKLSEVLLRELIVLVFPSAALDTVVSEMSGQCSETSILVSAIKGFEERTLLTPLQFIARSLKNPLAVISGPSFAAEIVRGRPAGVVAASRGADTARAVAEVFSSSTMKVYTSGDTLGVELGGAVKNVIALAAGISDGMDLGESARAGLITRGLAEMTRLAIAMGADTRTLSGLSGLGDLAMTATSPLSRNRTAGILIGRGRTTSEAIDEIGSVVEGIHSAPLVLRLATQYGIEMPITEQVALLLEGRLKTGDVVQNLLQRPLKSEF